MNLDLSLIQIPLSHDTTKPLKPLKLHALLAGADVWTDDLWDEAMRYLDSRLGLPQSVEYKHLLYRLKKMDGQEPGIPGVEIAKRDNLAGYRDFEPALLLAVFDHFRQHGHRPY